MSWILELVGVVLLSVLADIVLPNGQTNKFIKGIIAVLLIFVLISPIAGFISGEYDLDFALDGISEIQTDQSFVEDVEKRRESNTESTLLNALTIHGAEVQSVDIACLDNSNEVQSVQVNLTQPFDNSTVKQVICSYINVGEDNIFIYE